MRVMVIVKGTKESESGALPTERDLKEMGAFNEELAKAGVLLAADGLHPSSEGKRVRFSDGEKIVSDGPFGGDPNDLVAGFWLWRVKTIDEAVEWLKRAPFQGGTEVEIRPVFEAEEFAASDPTGEIRRREEEMRRSAAEAQLH